MDIDKQIIKDAVVAGMTLNRIKTTDRIGIFPPNVGGFSYDLKQLRGLTKFSELIKARAIAEMQKEGYVLVPIEQTNEMKVMGAEALDIKPSQAVAVYKAMLEAAPKPQKATT